MHFDVLGPLRAFGAGGRVSIPAGRSSAALCWLLLNANDWVSIDSMSRALWPDPVPSSSGRVRMLLRGLGPLLDAGTLEFETRARLVVSDDAVDALRFERLVTDGRVHLVAGRHDRAHANLRDAMALWRSEPCPELGRAGPAQAVLDRLAELRLGAQEELNALVLHQGVDYPLVADLRAQVILHPQRPRLHRQLALALYRTDRQVEALDVLRELRTTHGDVDGLADGLQSAMLQHDPALGGTEHPYD